MVDFYLYFWIWILIAKHLSARLLMLQSMFSVGRVWPQLPSRFRIAIKSVARVQTFVPFRNAIKSFCLQKCVRLRKFVVPSAVTALAVSSRRQNGKKKL